MIIPMKYELTQIEDNRIGVTVTNEEKVVGILYFEKAKLNFSGYGPSQLISEHTFLCTAKQ